VRSSCIPPAMEMEYVGLGCETPPSLIECQLWRPRHSLRRERADQHIEHTKFRYADAPITADGTFQRRHVAKLDDESAGPDVRQRSRISRSAPPHRRQCMPTPPAREELRLGTPTTRSHTRHTGSTAPRRSPVSPRAILMTRSGSKHGSTTLRSRVESPLKGTCRSRQDRFQVAAALG
jgi:hypothetical protein